MPELISSVGMEYEVEDILPRIPDSLTEHFNVTHDASCETDGGLLNNGLIVKKVPQIFPYRRVTLGGEIVSGILDTTDESYITLLKSLTGYLIEKGESPESYRAGVHVHVCYTNPNLRMLKNTLKLWAHLEDIFYHIGGMGYKFRGEENDSIYCRPLTGNGPIAVPVGSNYFAKSLDLGHLLASKTISEFWERWGDMLNNRGQRYFPVRYHGFNLSPNLERGTIEFRVFNKTLNPLFLYAIIELCKSFAEFCLFSKGENFSGLGFSEEHSVFEGRNSRAMIASLERFGQIVEMNESVTRTLSTIIDRTPAIHLDPGKVYISHLRQVRNHWQNSSYTPSVVEREKLAKPRFVDVHVLRGE